MVQEREPGPLRVLVVDDEDPLRAALEDFLRARGMRVRSSRDGQEALEILNKEKDGFQVVITDLNMPRAGGLEVLRAAKEKNNETQVVIITGFASLETAIDSMHHGAFDYITKPFQLIEIGLILNRIQERRKLIEENRQLSERILSLYTRLDLLKDNRARLSKFISETSGTLEVHGRKIDECLGHLRTLSQRLEERDLLSGAKRQ